MTSVLEVPVQSTAAVEESAVFEEHLFDVEGLIAKNGIEHRLLQERKELAPIAEMQDRIKDLPADDPVALAVKKDISARLSRAQDWRNHATDPALQ
jgi:hypothetical protein